MSVVDPKGSGGNRNRYVVATQDEALRRRLRGVVGVPLVYVRRSVMILEPMARATEEVREREAKEKVRAGLVGRRDVLAGVGEKRKREGDDIGGEEEKRKREGGDIGDDGEVVVQRKKKQKGPKGPNPLSAKKAKPKPVEEGERAAKKVPRASTNGDAQDAKKRKRRRKPKDVHAAGEVEVEA